MRSTFSSGGRRSSMKRADRYRAFGRNDDFDPRETLVNLFDVAMVFAVALMVAFVIR